MASNQASNRGGHSNYIQLLHLSCIWHAKHKKRPLFCGSRFQCVMMCHNDTSWVSPCCITTASSIMLWNRSDTFNTHASSEAASSFSTQTFLWKLSAQATLIVTTLQQDGQCWRHTGAAVTLLPPIKKLWVWTCQLVANKDWVREAEQHFISRASPQMINTLWLKQRGRKLCHYYWRRGLQPSCTAVNKVMTAPPITAAPGFHCLSGGWGWRCTVWCNLTVSAPLCASKTCLDRLIKTANSALFDNCSMDWMGPCTTVSRSSNNRARTCKDIAHTCSLYDLSFFNVRWWFGHSVPLQCWFAAVTWSLS